MNRAKVRVVIIETSEIIREGLKLIIESSHNITVRGLFDNVESCVSSHIFSQTDVVIVNPSLVAPQKHSLVTTLFNPSRVVALQYTYFDNDLLANYHSIIEINMKSAKIIKKLEEIADIDHDAETTGESSDLSQREKEVIAEVAKGLTNKEIANVLNISVHTVISHRKNISRKTDIKSVSGFVVYALLNKLVDEHDIK